MQDHHPPSYLKYLIVTVLMVGLYIGFMLLEVYAHEESHKAVFKDYGISSTIEYNFNPFNSKDYLGLTKPELNNLENCDSGCTQIHALIEVIGTYAEYVITIFFIMLFLFYTYYFFERA